MPQIIAASPYTPAIHSYHDPVPKGNYESFAELAGCGKGSSEAKRHSGVFECLVAADTAVLQNASGTVSESRGYFGSFAWLPVVDGDMIQRRPSSQLLSGHVSGKRLLVGVSCSNNSELTLLES